MIDGSNANALSSDARPHRLAHRALADLTQRLLDVAHLEEQFQRIGLRVLHRRLHFHQVGVGGQHARIVGYAVLARHIDDDLAFDRPRQVPVVAWPRGLLVFAETQNDGTLLRVDPIDAAAHPDDGEQHQSAAQTSTEVRRVLSAACAATAASEKGRQPSLKIPQDIVQIVLRLLRGDSTGCVSRRQVRSKPCVMPK